MSVGLTVDRATLDSRAGNIAWQIRELFDNAETLATWLNDPARTDQVLMAAPFNYTQDEVTTLRTAFVALDTLAKIAAGTQANASTYPYLSTLRPLTGVQ